MRQTEQTARTVEEAVEQGLQLLGVTKDQVEVEILDEPGGGLFGIGAKQARVRVYVPEVDVDKAREVMEGIVKLLNLNAMVEVEQAADTVRIDVLGDDLGILIGHRGQTLNALQFLLGVILTKGMESRRVRCIVDVEGYRVRREKSLQMLAENMARKASVEHREVALEPMLPHERRIIHLALEKSPYVITSSRGKEPSRCVVIKPKEGTQRMGKERTRSPQRDPNSRRGPSAGNRSGRNSNRGNTRQAESRWGYSRSAKRDATGTRYGISRPNAGRSGSQKADPLRDHLPQGGRRSGTASPYGGHADPPPVNLDDFPPEI